MRRTFTVALLSFVAIGAVACGGSRKNAAAPAGSTTAAGSTPPASSSPASSGSSTPATGGSPTSGSEAGPNQCAESQLRASVDPRHIPGNGTQGSDGKSRHGVLIDFQNTSPSACTLIGYPGAAIVDQSGKQVQQATRTLRGSLGGLPSGQSAPALVSLKPGSYAAAFIEGVDTRQVGAAQAGCDAPNYPRILVTPPNTKIAVPFTAGWPVCYSFTVHPLQTLTSPPN